MDATTWANAVDHPFFIIFDLAMGGGFPAAFGGGPNAVTVVRRPDEHRLRRGLQQAGRAAAAAVADGTDIAQGKPTTASSTESAAFPASNATDGNTGTRWSSAFSDPQWLQVDLGQSYQHQPRRR